MTDRQNLSNWKNQVRYSVDGPQHVVLIDTGHYRAVLVGLEAGARIPPHPSSDATYHFLEGTGWMIVDGERQLIEPGATIVVPAGADRGIEAETRLAFLGSHAGHKGQASDKGDPFHHKRESSRGPMLLFGLMTIFMLVVMIGLVQIGASPMAAMLTSFGNLGMGVWGIMLLPMLGLLGMGVMMFFMYRTMGNALNPAKHSVTMADRADTRGRPADLSLETTTYTIPSISCGGCRKTIEEKLTELEGVDTVDVDVGSKSAVVRYHSPATKRAIELLLEKIGYPVEAG